MSVIKISQSAYLYNLNQIANKVGDKNRIYVVLKDNAYGHGAMIIAPLARDFGIKKAVVRTLGEAEEILEFFDEVLVLSQVFDGNENINPKIKYAINDKSALLKIKSGANAHIALDTMMHRHGLGEGELEWAFKTAKERNISICGAYTHFCAADEMSGVFALQLERFNELKKGFSKLCEDYKMPSPCFHSHNSAGIERSAKIANECVRVGIAQYGYAQFDDSLGLKPVLSLFAHRLSTRMLKKGQCVGYGGAFCASDDMRISTYDLGYADGLLRYDGKGEFAFNAKDKMLGRMSMDSFSANCDDDELCVINDANIWAKAFGTICYDILVKLSPKIKRILVS